MQAFLFDPDLDLPDGAGSVQRIRPPEAGLIRHDRATDQAIVLAGRRCVVDATGLAGIQGILADGKALVGQVRLSGPAAANVVSTPRSLTRERVGAGGRMSETVLLPERLPGAVVQWYGEVADGLTLEVRLPEVTPGDEGRYRVDGPLVRWATSGTGTGAVLQFCGESDEGWRIEERDGESWATLSFRLHAERHATLLANAIGDPLRLPSLPALAAVRAHRRRDELEPDDAAGLRLTTGVVDLDEGVAWARAALRASLAGARDPELRWSADSSLVPAALAAGEWEVARTALARPLPELADAEARARWMAWTGVPGPLTDARPTLDPVLADAPQSVRSRVADAAEAAGETEWATELRTPVARGGARRLPTLGGSVGTPPASAPPPRPTAAQGSAEELSAAIRDLRSSEPDAGLVLLRSALSWARRAASPRDAARAGAILRLVVEGLLGVEPDAAFGRVHLSPSLPASWDAFHARGILVGDAVVDMQMTRKGLTYQFALRQRAGGAPVTWIFAPRLPGQGIARVSVDGEDALVDSRLVGRRIEPRVQIPAERERLVEIELTPP